MLVLGIDPGWRNCGMALIEWNEADDTFSPLMVAVDDLLGNEKMKQQDSDSLLRLLEKWLERRREVLAFAECIIIEWQKDRSLNMFIPFLAGAFPNKVQYFTKNLAHKIHRVATRNNNRKNKEAVEDYMKHFLITCPIAMIPPTVEIHHASDAAFIATAYCIDKMIQDKALPHHITCMSHWLPDCQ